MKMHERMGMDKKSISIVSKKDYYYDICRCIFKIKISISSIILISFSNNFKKWKRKFYFFSRIVDW